MGALLVNNLAIDPSLTLLELLICMGFHYAQWK